MRVIVTGTSGYVGAATALTLHEYGHDVICISRSPNTVLPQSLLHYSLDIGASDFPERLQQVGGVDAVVHAAAVIDSAAGAPEIIRTNCVGTAHLLEAARNLHAACFVYFSSLSILGKPVLHPITEEHPLAPSTPYAVSKLAGEQLVLLASGSLRTVALRISSPVGPGLRPGRIFHAFVRNAKKNTPLLVNGTGGRCQDYVDVRDIARATLQALDSTCSGVYNLGAGKAVSNVDLARICTKTLKSSSEILMTGQPDPDDDICWDLSIDKAVSGFHYNPGFPLERSILDLASTIV